MFAKIFELPHGQVLVRKDSGDGPVLSTVVEVEGAFVEANVSYKDTDRGHSARDRDFDAYDAEKAAAVRATVLQQLGLTPKGTWGGEGNTP